MRQHGKHMDTKDGLLHGDPNSKVGWANVGRTSRLSDQRWPNVGPTNLSIWWLPRRLIHQACGILSNMLRHHMEMLSRVTGPLCRESTGHRWWIPLTNGQISASLSQLHAPNQLIPLPTEYILECKKLSAYLSGQKWTIYCRHRF